jgi:hypothetical protein
LCAEEAIINRNSQKSNGGKRERWKKWNVGRLEDWKNGMMEK